LARGREPRARLRSPLRETLPAVGGCKARAGWCLAGQLELGCLRAMCERLCGTRLLLLIK